MSRLDYNHDIRVVQQTTSFCDMVE